MKKTTIVSSIILSIISGILSYLIINHYIQQHKLNTETDQEVNIYIILDDTSAVDTSADNDPQEKKINLKPYLDNNLLNQTPLNCLDLTLTPREPIYI